MSRLLPRLIAAAVLCATGQGSLVSHVHADIEGSVHDFRSPDSISTDEDASKEICVYCHTPTGEQAAAAPRWNPQTDRTAFDRQSTFGNASLEQNIGEIGPVSVTCFSCHDGTQASDAGFVGAVLPSGTPPQPGHGLGLSPPPPYTMMSDEAGRHPMLVPYASGVCSGVETDCDPGADPRTGVSFNVARFDVINSVKSWWIDTDGGLPGQRDRSDIILYPREDHGSIGPAVECGSCHDPHDGRRRPVSFLRLEATGDALCMGCHTL